MRASSTSSTVATCIAAGFAYFLSGVSAQSYQRHNLTPDGFWHNRYHALLSMAAYGDYNELCPEQTFDEEAMRQNFPQSTRAPWTVINTFGPTPSGCEGFTAIVPEMNKALIIFKGDYELEQNLPLEVSSWDAIGLGQHCRNCTVNSFAARGYMECKAETNNWQAILGAYAGQGLVFSIAGHGLGGMHSQIASVDLNVQQVAYYSHAYGNPRVFNAAGAQFYDARFNGEAGERGIFNNDQYTEFIPEGPDYSHAGTPFYYSGRNATNGQPNWEICWIEDGQGYAACMPRQQGNSTPIQDHYFYFSNVGQCGGATTRNTTLIDSYISEWTNGAGPNSSASASSSASSASSSLSSSSSAPGPQISTIYVSDVPSAALVAVPPTTTATGQMQNAGANLKVATFSLFFGAALALLA